MTIMRSALLAASILGATAAHAGTFGGYGQPANDPTFTGATSVATFSGPSQTFASYSEAGVTFGPGAIEDIYADDYNATGSYYSNQQGNVSPITFAFASPTDAFAFNWGAADTAWTVELFAGATSIATYALTATFSNNDKQYFGFTGNGITSVTLSNGGSFDWVFIDNLTFGAAGAVVPEPATWAMMIGGFGFAGGALRRRRTTLAYA